jgi:hypothetical protein
MVILPGKAAWSYESAPVPGTGAVGDEKAQEGAQQYALGKVAESKAAHMPAFGKVKQDDPGQGATQDEKYRSPDVGRVDDAFDAFGL